MRFKKLESEQKLLLGIKILVVLSFFGMVYTAMFLRESTLCYKRYELALQADHWMLEARLSEKEFNLHGSNEYVLKVKDAIEKTKNIMLLLREDFKSLEKYSVAFSELVDKKASFAEFEEQLEPLARAVFFGIR